MKDITRRDMCKILGLGALASTGFLVGCGGGASEGGSQGQSAPNKAYQPITIPLSEAIGNGRTLWYEARIEKVAKDGQFNALYVFENGQVTYYDNRHMTFGDLDGLEDEEIIESFKVADEQRHNETFEILKKNYTDSREPDFLDELTSIGDYRLPKPYDYVLRIETDNTGNITTSEEISSMYIYFTGGGQSEGPEWREGTIRIFAETSGAAFTVYNTQYGGYLSDNYAFITKVEEDVSFSLDEPGTAGIEID